MKIITLGLGYIGLPTSLMFANHGATVVGVDISNEIVKKLNQGEITIEEPGIQEALNQARITSNFKAKTTPETGDVFIVAVPTPNNQETKGCNLSYVMQAINSIVPYLETGNTIIIESTIAPNTMLDVIRPFIENQGFIVGKDIFLVHCPERVLPGNIFYELVHNDRIIGGVTAACIQKGQEVYQLFVKGTLLATDASTAEMAKLVENTYRDVNIALANELALISNELKIDVLKVIQLANRHPRVNVHSPGPGVGGHCLAVDPYFITEAAPTQSPLIQLARQINTQMPKYIVEQVVHLMENAATNKITIFGQAYKGNIDDIRESPAVKIKELLVKEGFDIEIYEPHVPDISIPEEQVCHDSSLILVLTDHQEFSDITETFTNRMADKLIFDTKDIVQIFKENVQLVNLGSITMT